MGRVRTMAAKLGSPKGVASMRNKLILVVMACAFALCITPRAFGQANASFYRHRYGQIGIGDRGGVGHSSFAGYGRNALGDHRRRRPLLIPLVPVGNYTMRVEYKGFQTSERKDVKLQVDEGRELDFSISPLRSARK